LCENCQRQSCKAFIGLTIHNRKSMERAGRYWEGMKQVRSYRRETALQGGLVMA